MKTNLPAGSATHTPRSGAACPSCAIDLVTVSAYGRGTVNWVWAKRKPLMQRSFAEDVAGALFVFAGALLGYLVLGGRDASVLLGCAIGLILMIAVVNVARRVHRRRNA